MFMVVNQYDKLLVFVAKLRSNDEKMAKGRRKALF